MTSCSSEAGFDCAPLDEGALPGILALQEANLREKLSAEQQQAGGFLSARFDAAQFRAMAAGGAVVVARGPQGVAGYACASTLAWNRQFALLRTMIDTLPGLQFGGEDLGRADPLVYGPVCIAPAARGQGLLRQMHGVLCSLCAPRHRLGVCFVAADNPRSLAAHGAGLGMQAVGGFRHGAGDYRILAFAVAAAERR